MVVTRAAAAAALSLAFVLAPLASSAHAQTSNSPLTVALGDDAALSLGGFIDATGVHRGTATSSGLGTSFGTIPFSDTVPGSLSETLLSAQNSRVTLAATARVGEGEVKGYLEADFLGSAPPGLNVTANSNGLRMRVYWMRYRRHAFEFLGGQAWSLLTPSRNGLSPDTNDVFFTLNVDPNYQAGLTWTRQMQFRFGFHPTDTLAAAVSLENPDQYVGSAVVLPNGFPAGEVDTGTLTFQVPNAMPDIVAKVAFDPKHGRLHQHVDAGVIVRRFRTFEPAAGTHEATGAGAQVTAAVEPIAPLRLIASAYLSSGGGRYLAQSNVPDLVVAPDGILRTVDANSLLAGAEGRVGDRLLLFGYASGVRTRANVIADAGGSPIGFGVPASAGANERIAELTSGLTHTFFRDPKQGAMQLMLQYSHLWRRSFARAEAATDLFYVNVRYVLP
ncbi:MAG TPA: hypothetical protein VFB07_06215 [Vicinamibacterales bacterium]|nr:hypothetical protein [Vicinamibacterales bacterium]